MRRAIGPLNPRAVAAANRALAAKHPELAGPNGSIKPLDANDPKTLPLRREWMNSYAANGGKVELDHTSERVKQIYRARAAARAAPDKPPTTARTPCPADKAGADKAGADKAPAPPPASPAKTPCGAGLICKDLKVTLGCSHDGRKPCPSTHLLEVVPAEAGDVIALSCATACGKPAVWPVSGVLNSEQNGNKTSFRAQRWFLRAAAGLDWAATVMPQTYRVHAQSQCGHQSASYTVKAYPSDKFALSINGKEWANMKSKIDYALDVVLGAYVVNPSFEFLVGKGDVSAAWEEDPKSHRAFYAWKASVGFDPLFGAKVRIPFGPLAAIPQWVKKYGDAYFFVEFSGGVSISGEWGRTGPSKISGTVKAAGKINGKIGGSMFLVGSSVIVMEVAGSSGITFEAAPDLTSVEKPALAVEGKWDGLKAEITIIAARGIVEFKREFNVCDAQTIMDKKPFYVFG